MPLRLVNATVIFAPLLLVALVGLCALPFAATAEVLMACGLAAAIVVITNLPLHLLSGLKNLRLTLVAQLMAVLFRLVAAMICAAILHPHYTEAFILIFSLSLSLSIIFDAVLLTSRPQEPAHA